MMMVRKFWRQISLILGLVFLYRDSFNSSFFQDDKILFDIAHTKGLFEPLVNFPYRPIAIQVFYNFSSNPLVLHLTQFCLFIFGLYFVYKISKDWFATFFVAFNISVFPLFYWVATSYFSFAFFFNFAAISCYLNKKTFLAVILFIAGLLSNEILVVFPVLLALISWYLGKIEFKRIGIFTLIDAIYLPLRIFLIPFPTASDYQINFLKFFATARWYFLRIFNLPEGIRGNEYLIYFLFGVLIVLVCLKVSNIKFKVGLFALSWFFIGTLPFFFLPNHMSSYYLTLSTFGPAVFLSKLMTGKFRILFLLIYIGLAFFGLEYLRTTHWIILKNTGPIGSFI